MSLLTPETQKYALLASWKSFKKIKLTFLASFLKQNSAMELTYLTDFV